MIQVYERQSNRVPGITSLYLSFDFNQSIIDTIKNNCEAYDFNKKTKEWELPIKNCSNILDLLSFLDEILINVLPNKENAMSVELNMNYKTPPKEYQIDAIKFIKQKHKFDMLPQELKDIADIRIKNPDISYEEIGKLLKNNISKSGVSHRLKKICNIAEDLKNE